MNGSVPWPLAPSQVFLAIDPVDMRKGADGLSMLLQHGLGRAPTDGSAYAFRNRAGNRLKLLLWDGTGVWLCGRLVPTLDARQDGNLGSAPPRQLMLSPCS